MSQSTHQSSTSSSSSLILSSPTLLSLPSDALLCILSYLSAIDLTNLHEALPSNSDARHIVAHPFLWRTLYAKDFPPLTSALPHLRVTARGFVDWRAAYWSADRRRIAVQASRRDFAYRPFSPLPSSQTGAAAGGIRVVIEGNIRRIISDRPGHPTVVEDGRVARFDWAARDSQDHDHEEENSQ